MPGGGFGGGNGSSDVKLQYIDDDPESYQNIFGNAKTDVTSNDEARLIESLKKLSSYEDLEDVLDMDAVLRYFVVHNFVVNGDSYTGSMIHNYYLYEQDGKLSMLPWDYNLAFGGFQGNDATSSVNDPIDDVLSDRPMQAWIFSSEAYTARYHEYYAEFLQTANIDALIDETYQLIVLYVEKDPTKFCTAEEFETGVQTLKTYCALRERSVQGQLDGTIASTSAAQQEDGTSLVDASSITLSDMGSMANTMGGGRGFDRKNGEESADGAFTPPERPQDGSFQPPSETEAPEDADAASGSSQDIQTASGEDNAARPQRPDDNAADNPASTGHGPDAACAAWRVRSGTARRSTLRASLQTAIRNRRRENPCACAYGLVVIFADGTVKDIGNFLAGGFVEQRDNHAYQHADRKARQQLVDAGRTGQEQVPQNIRQRARYDACNCALVAQAPARTARESRPDRTPSRSRPRRFQPCS